MLVIGKSLQTVCIENANKMQIEMFGGSGKST